MTDFIQALSEFDFLRRALFAGLMASVAAGVVGTYVVTRRITAIVGSLAHAVLGGMGIAYWLSATQGWNWLSPIHGAIVAAVAGALILGFARTRVREREDTVISALWAVGMAVGILFLFQTPGYKADLMTYLFGNIAMVDPGALPLLIGLDVAVVLIAFLFYNPLLAVCFDEEFARLRGLNVEAFYTMLLLMAALTVVTLVYVVGIVMAIALVTLPVSVAGRFSSRLWQMMVLASILSGTFTTAGLAIGYSWDLPAGAVTILLAATVFIAVHAGSMLIRRRSH